MGSSAELQQQMLEAEASYWKEMARKNGRGWWNARKDAIEKKRGRAALDKLLEEMNGNS